MGKSFLSDAQKEQCRSMSKDGKRPFEIIGFFKEKYNIDLKSPTLNYILHGKKKQGVASDAKAKRKYTHKSAASIPQVNNSDDLVAHIHAAWNIHKKGFVAKVEEILAAI
jgi:hypothetical protein